PAPRTSRRAALRFRRPEQSDLRRRPFAAGQQAAVLPGSGGISRPRRLQRLRPTPGGRFLGGMAGSWWSLVKALERENHFPRRETDNCDVAVGVVGVGLELLNLLPI